MPPKLYYLPVVLAIVLTGVVGFQLGRAAPPSEGDVIERWAAEYVAWAGADAKATDCFAMPGGGEVWIVITCVPKAPQQTITYAVMRDDNLAQPGKMSIKSDA